MTREDKLRAFATEILHEWDPYADYLGVEMRRVAIKHGLLELVDPAPTRPCGDIEHCECSLVVKVDGNGEFIESARPVKCYRDSDVITCGTCEPRRYLDD